MKERPILFSAPMVRALLAGTKTQTRRVVKPRDLAWMDEHQGLREKDNAIRCPYGQPGDRLWVRETWNRFAPWEGFYYAADYEGFGIGPDDDPDYVPDHAVRWKPSIHMPRTASRITLEVVAVRVERLQDIGQGDACAEGAPAPHEPIDWYRALWEQINGPGSWGADPWVWVVEFKRIEEAA